MIFLVNCPLCKIPMNEMTKSGVLIDVCPQCRGVWLDRGELEKIVSSSREAVRDYDELNRYYEDHHDRDKRRYDERHHEKQYAGNSHGHYKKKKKHGIFEVFGDLFD